MKIINKNIAGFICIKHTAYILCKHYRLRKLRRKFIFQKKRKACICKCFLGAFPENLPVIGIIASAFSASSLFLRYQPIAVVLPYPIGATTAVSGQWEMFLSDSCILSDIYCIKVFFASVQFFYSLYVLI